MLLLCVILVAAGLVVVAVLAALLRHAFRAHPPVKLAWRWLSGLPWQGREPVPDVTWWTPGSPGAAVRGRVRRFYYRRRAARTLIRWSEMLGVLVPGVILGTHYHLALRLAACTGVAALASVRPHPERKHRRLIHKEVLRPLHSRLHGQVGVPATWRPRQWLEIAHDRSWFRVYVPDAFDPNPKALETVTRAVAPVVFVDNEARVSAHMGGRRRFVEFQAALPPPPPLVLLDPDPARQALGIRHLIEQAAWHELVMGYGINNKPVIKSLGKAVPHWGLSMPTGDGKSVTVELLEAQMLYHGAVGFILDYKVFSHPWALFEMPNVVYCGLTAQIHLALMWLKGEAERRRMRGLDYIQMDGSMSGSLGPVIFVVAEELNATIVELKTYWKSIDGTGESPAIAALRELLAIGRQLGIHFLLIAQKLTVAALGGKDSAARENCAGLVIGGSASPSTWDMLARDVERPAKQTVPGRHFVVTGGEVELCQVAFLTPQGNVGPQARELALAGAVTAVPEDWQEHPYWPEGISKDLSGRVKPPVRRGGVSAGDICQTAGQGAMRALPAAPVTDVRGEPVGIDEACKLGIIPVSKVAARGHRHKDPGFPKEVPDAEGPRNEKRYWPHELAEFYRVKGYRAA
jgi:hypothetical protein